MADPGRVLVARGAGTIKTIQFWRLAWEELERDRRPRRLVFAALGGRGTQVFVAGAAEFRDVVMRGPRADYMASPSWKGETDWARQDPLPGGSYLFDWRDSPSEPVLDRLVPFIRRRADVIAEWGDEVDLIAMTTTGPRVERAKTSMVFG